MGKYEKRKGYRNEYNLVRKLKKEGFHAERIPLSGATWMKGDLVLDGWIGEVKARKDSFKKLYDWLKDVQLLFIKDDRKPWLVVMRLDNFIEIWRRMG